MIPLVVLVAAAGAAPIVHPPPPVAIIPAPRAPVMPQRPGRAQVLAAVQAEWRTYDRRGQGRLGPLEFGTWVMHANGADVQMQGRDTTGIKPVTAMNVTARAFAAADANHDGGVTPEELTTYLMARPAAPTP